MSVRIMAMVWELKVPPTEKLVLLALADHAQDSGSGAYPSVATLARKTGLTPRMVPYVLKRNRKSGLLATVGTHTSGAVIYRFVLPTPLNDIQGYPPEQYSPLNKTATPLNIIHRIIRTISKKTA